MRRNKYIIYLTLRIPLSLIHAWRLLWILLCCYLFLHEESWIMGHPQGSWQQRVDWSYSELPRIGKGFESHSGEINLVDGRGDRGPLPTHALYWWCGRKEHDSSKHVLCHLVNRILFPPVQWLWPRPEGGVCSEGRVRGLRGEERIGKGERWGLLVKEKDEEAVMKGCRGGRRAANRGWWCRGERAALECDNV